MGRGVSTEVTPRISVASISMFDRLQQLMGTNAGTIPSELRARTSVVTTYIEQETACTWPAGASTQATGSRPGTV